MSVLKLRLKQESASSAPKDASQAITNYIKKTATMSEAVDASYGYTFDGGKPRKSVFDGIAAAIYKTETARAALQEHIADSEFEDIYSIEALVTADERPMINTLQKDTLWHRRMNIRDTEEIRKDAYRELAGWEPLASDAFGTNMADYLRTGEDGFDSAIYGDAANIIASYDSA